MQAAASIDDAATTATQQEGSRVEDAPDTGNVPGSAALQSVIEESKEQQEEETASEQPQ